MKVCVIGWYGTETIGDRGILAGITSLLSKQAPEFEVAVGSMYPFFTERTLHEDLPFYNKISSHHNFSFEVFDSRSSKILKQQIDSCDLLVIGGGPLMHIEPVFMLEYAFKYAKKKGKPSMVFGCGIGPLRVKKYIKSVENILTYADEVVLRGDASINYLKEVSGNKKIIDKCKVSIDGAVEAVLNYRELPEDKRDAVYSGKYIAVNLRRFPHEYGDKATSKKVDEALIAFVGRLVDTYKDYKINMVPMHYFHVGEDDRDFMNQVKLSLPENENLFVQNKNFNLEETLSAFNGAEINFGMRFHSVLFQTILRGNNFILDYTEPRVGKIGGFINRLDLMDDYEGRMINLQDKKNLEGKFFPDIIQPKENKVSTETLREILDIYTNSLTAVL